AGTLSGNPVAVAAGLAALKLLSELDPYPELAERAETLTNGLAEAFETAAVPHTINRVESLFSVFFSDRPAQDFEGAKAADHQRYAKFFHAMIDQRIYLPPSGYEAWFLAT